ncbi:PHP domain protein, partial [mine drainage metagenome]
MTGTRRLDLHIHSQHSPDSKMRLETIVGQLGRTGLSGFALTDHNSVAGHDELRELQRRNPGYLFVPGVEVSALEGHLLAYGIPTAPPVHRPVAETIDWVLAHGGEPVLAHPFRRSHGVGRRIAETAAIRAMEVRNGHNPNSPTPARSSWPANEASDTSVGAMRTPRTTSGARQP